MAKQKIPFSKNDQFELEITGLTHDGMGVGRKDGVAVFVAGALDGEKIIAHVIKTAGNYAVAKVVETLEASPNRIEPFCSVYKRCGGCSLQHMTYEKTLDFKKQTVVDNLARIGGLDDIVVNDTIGMKTPMRYRNKAQYPVGVGDYGVVAGFFARRSHEIVDASHCGIQHKSSELARAAVLKYIQRSGATVYNEETRSGLIRHIVSRVGIRTNEVAVTVVATMSRIPDAKLLVDILRKQVPGLVGVVLNVNTSDSSVVMGDENYVLFGSPYITDRLGQLFFEIPTTAFYQVNPEQTEKLYAKALAYAALTGTETVFDLYCGIGTIAIAASRKAGRVIGVEVVPDAIESAEENARRNKAENVTFHEGTVEDVVPKLLAEGIYADVVIVDPPRKGCDAALLATILQMAPKRIVYVSCNPGTLARDLKTLTEGGYEAIEATPVDMFPWTEHVETVVLLQKHIC